MAPVKLDSPVKVFVVSVSLDSLERIAVQVLYPRVAGGGGGGGGLPYEMDGDARRLA